MALVERGEVMMMTMMMGVTMRAGTVGVGPQDIPMVTGRVDMVTTKSTVLQDILEIDIMVSFVTVKLCISKPHNDQSSR